MMKRVVYHGLAAIAVIAVPATAQALSTATFDGFSFYDVFITAPGATVETTESSTPEGASTTGKGVIDSFDSPVVLSPVGGSADAAGSVPGPDGTVDLLADSGVSTRVTAADDPVSVTIDYVLSAQAAASMTTDPGDVTEAFVVALSGISVFSSTDVLLLSDEAFAETDALSNPFGLVFDSASGEEDGLTFDLAAGDFLVIESFATVDGFAEAVSQVPLPPAFALLLGGLAGLGALARRRS